MSDFYGKRNLQLPNHAYFMKNLNTKLFTLWKYKIDTRIIDKNTKYIEIAK